MSPYDLASQGLHVFPVDHPSLPECAGLHNTSPCDGKRGKHPAVAWGHAATTNPKMIATWFEGRTRNVGISCGPSGLVVLDEDEPDVLNQWAEANGVSLPDTYTVITGKGRHLYYAYDHAVAPIRNAAARLFGALAIDVRGDGGFVVADGSVHQNGGVYAYNGAAIAPLPGELAQRLLTAQDAPTGKVRTEVFVDPNSTPIPYGKRYRELLKYAGRLRSRGLDYAEAEILFRKRFELCEQPPGKEAPYDLAKQNILDDVYTRYDAGRTTADQKPTFSLLCLADVAPERVSWLWPGRIPLGKLVTLDGDPGLGKSTLGLNFAAPVTTGGVWPDGTTCAHPGAVLLMSAEDGLADTVRPRADVAGADVARVHAIAGVPVPGDDGGPPTLRPPTIADVTAMEDAIRQTGARLLLIDVLMAYLPTGVDSHKDQDIRRVLSRLSELADRTGCTILLIRHLNKTTGRDPLYRGGGSIGIVGAARAGLLVAPDPDDPERRVLASIKSNLGPPPESLTYRLVEGGDYGVARVQWEGATTHTAHGLLASPDDAEDRREVDGWLRDYLEAEGNANARDVIRDGKLAGFSEDQVKKARRRIGATSTRQGFGKGATVVWCIGAIDAIDDSHSEPASMAPMEQQPPPAPRRPGCICIGEPEPCYHCQNLASKQENAQQRRSA